MTASELADRFEKCLKTLRKAEDACDGRDAGRVSLLLRRADEHVVAFEMGSGLSVLAASLSASRAAAGAGDFDAAASTLRQARESLRSLSDYTVARTAEVAYRSSLAALENRSAQDFEAALQRMEAAVKAPFLADRLHEAREAIARGRAAMVRKDMKAGQKEIETARFALGRMDYAASLSQARYGLVVAAELLRSGAYLTAREQTQQGVRAIRKAFDRAPETHVETLDAALAAVEEVWRRLSKPEPGDPDQLDAAADRIESLRQQLR